MAQVKIRNEKILSEEKYTLTEIEFELQNKDGEWEAQKRQVLDHGNAVTVLLYNKEKRTIILTKQFRIATYVNGNSTGMLVETPAGLLEGKEDPAEGMKREIEEETGYRIPHLQKVFEAYTSAGILTELVYFYAAPYTDAQKVAEGGGLEEEGENVKVLELSFDEVIQAIEKREIRDVKTILLVQYAQLKKLLG